MKIIGWLKISHHSSRGGRNDSNKDRDFHEGKTGDNELVTEPRIIIVKNGLLFRFIMQSKSSQFFHNGCHVR